MDLKRCEDRTLRRTATTKVAIDHGCSTCYSRNVPSRSCRRQKQSRDGKCDVREHEHRLDKTLDGDGVILALAPLQVQNQCHLNSHILKRYAQDRTMLFHYCRAQADAAAGDVVPMAGQWQRQHRHRRQEGQRPRQSNTDENEKDKDKKSKGKAHAKATEYFAGYCLLCKAW